MTKAEFLKIIQSQKMKKDRLRTLRGYLDEQRESLTGLSAVRYDKPVVKTSYGNGNEAALLQYIDGTENAVKRYNAILDEVLEDEERISSTLSVLNSGEYTAIVNRYINGFSVQKTAQIMHYSEGHIKELCASALKKFGEL